MQRHLQQYHAEFSPERQWENFIFSGICQCGTVEKFKTSHLSPNMTWCGPPNFAESSMLFFHTFFSCKPVIVVFVRHLIVSFDVVFLFTNWRTAYQTSRLASEHIEEKRSLQLDLNAQPSSTSLISLDSILNHSSDVFSCGVSAVFFFLKNVFLFNFLCVISQ